MAGQEISVSKYGILYKNNADAFSALRGSLDKELQQTKLDQIAEMDKVQYWEDMTLFAQTFAKSWANLVMSMSFTDIQK